MTTTNERAELVASLKAHYAFPCYPHDPAILLASDMLEAYARLEDQLADQKTISGNWKARALKAQQVAVPMTEAQIFECDPAPHEMFDKQRIDFARAVEAHHGITPQGDKPC